MRIDIDSEMDRMSNGAYYVREHAEKSEFVTAHAEALAAHLEDAAAWIKRCGIDTAAISCLHEDKPGPPHWRFLALLVRDAVRKLAEAKKHRRLANLISRWAESEHLLLWRMALYAAAEAAKHFPEFRDGGNWGAKILVGKCGALWGHECRPECLRFLRKAGAGITPSPLTKLERVIREGPSRSKYRADAPEEDVAQVMRWEVATFLAKLELSGARLSPESARVLADARTAEPKVDFENRMEVDFKVGTFQAMPMRPENAPKLAELSAAECASRIRSAGWPTVQSFPESHPAQAVAAFEELAKQGWWDAATWSSFFGGIKLDEGAPDNLINRVIRLSDKIPDEALTAFACAAMLARLLRNIARVRRFSQIEKAWHRVWNLKLTADMPDPSFSLRSDHHVSAWERASRHAHGSLATTAVDSLLLKREDEREKLLGLLAEILASEKPSHKYGKVAVGRFVFPLFRDFPEWTRRRLLPFFTPNHPLAVDMWESFLHNFDPEMSADFLDAVKPALLHFMQSPEVFHDLAFQLMWVFLAGCVRHPGVIPPDERRKVGSKISPKGLEIFCGNLNRELRNKNSTEQGKKWRGWIFPLLQEVWPEKRPPNEKAPEVSRALASVVILTGDAFPEASQWAKANGFLSPIVGDGHPIHPVTSFRDDHQEQVRNIPAQFPRECLFFLDQVVPGEGFRRQYDLRAVLDKIQKVAPELEKRPEFRRLREIASGG